MGDLNPDEAASSFARSLRARGGRGSGLRPEPLIEVNETTIEPQRIGIGLSGSQPSAQAFPGGGGGSPTLWACCHSDDTCTDTTAAACDGTYLIGQHCVDDPCGCCSVTSIELIVELSGCVSLFTSTDCLCNTFDCTLDHTWMSPGDFNADPCSGNQTVAQNDVDNSGCVTCLPSGHTTSSGTTDYNVSIFPFAGPAKVQVLVDPAFLCDSYCGITTGGCNFGVLDNWITTDTCPIGTYHWSGDAVPTHCPGTGVLNYDITLIIS